MEETTTALKNGSEDFGFANLDLLTVIM